ncbi:MAG TPA: hypothetical protein VFH61_11215 [Thermoleophilia bacterium]|nr:hypothetical protein [Thermoleophilia bacterium]
MKRILLVLAIALAMLAVYAPAASAIETETTDLERAQATQQRWERLYDRYWSRMALAKCCLFDRSWILSGDMPVVDPDEEDPALWLECAQWYRDRVPGCKARANKLVARIRRPGTRKVAGWRACAQWYETRNPLSFNTVEDARALLRVIRRLYGPRPMLAHPLRTMRGVDAWWFADHPRTPFAPIDVDF